MGASERLHTHGKTLHMAKSELHQTHGGFGKLGEAEQCTFQPRTNTPLKGRASYRSTSSKGGR